MKKSANSNMYSYPLDETWKRFGAYLDASPDALVCIISTRLLGQESRAALGSAAGALGYGSSACTFLTRQPRAADQGEALGTDVAGQGEPPGTDAAGKGESPEADVAGQGAILKEGASDQMVGPALLEGNDLFAAIEGLDPLCLIITDREAAAACADAYRQAVPTQNCFRLLGRDTAAFEDFGALLADAAHKQAAWKLLKRLRALPLQPGQNSL